MTSGETFHQAARALFGDLYVAPIAHFLDRDKNLIGKWRNDKTAIPEEVWTWIQAALHARAKELETVSSDVAKHVVSLRGRQHIYTFRIKGFEDDIGRNAFAEALRSFIDENKWGRAQVVEAADFVRIDVPHIAQGQVDKAIAWIEQALEGRRDELGYRHGVAIAPETPNQVVIRHAEVRPSSGMLDLTSPAVIKSLMDEFDIKAPLSWPGTSLTAGKRSFVLTSSEPLNRFLLGGIRDWMRETLSDIGRLSFSQLVAGRNVNDGLIALSRPHRQEDVLPLQKSLDAFTQRHGLQKSVVAAHGKHIIVSLRDNLSGDLNRLYREWFNTECDRMNGAKH